MEMDLPRLLMFVLSFLSLAPSVWQTPVLAFTLSSLPHSHTLVTKFLCLFRGKGLHCHVCTRPRSSPTVPHLSCASRMSLFPNGSCEKSQEQSDVRRERSHSIALPRVCTDLKDRTNLEKLECARRECRLRVHVTVAGSPLPS